MLKKIGFGLILYVEDYSYYPISKYDNPAKDGTGTFATTWAEAILENQGLSPFSDKNGNTNGHLFICPSDPDIHPDPSYANNGRKYKLCYQYNSHVNYYNAESKGLGHTWIQASQVQNPSNLFAFVDQRMSGYSYRESHNIDVRAPRDLVGSSARTYFHGYVNNFFFATVTLKHSCLMRLLALAT